MADLEFKPLNIAVLTISDTRGEAEDVSGKRLVEALTAAGHVNVEKTIVKDDIYAIRATVSRWIADPSVDAVLTTGGTGITGRDGTPEAVTPLLDKVIDGFGEMFRLPGSAGACRLAWEKLISAQLDFRTKPCNLVQLMPRLIE